MAFATAIMGSHGRGADQTHKSHNIAPAVATGMGCGWQAQAALGSKMGPKTRQRRMEVSLKGASLRVPSHPQSIHPVSIPSWCTRRHMRPDVDSHEVGQRGPRRPTVQTASRVPASPTRRTHPRLSGPYYSTRYLNGEGYSLLVVQLDRRPT